MEVAAEDVVVGDVVLVRPGEQVPVDGMLLAGRAVVDESTLTGESRPVERRQADRIASGALNAGGPFEVRAVATEADSTYRGLVRLVEQAQAERPPFARLADRVAVWFVPFTLLVAGGAWWLSGDPIRALAVMVVATPCPLLLATPIAITSGMSRLARRGVVTKGGGALELLARAEVVLLDKTGTVTAGRPRVLDVEPFGGSDQDEVLRLAASLDQVSAHVFAPAIVQHALQAGAQLALPQEVSETPGMGIAGQVDGYPVRVGRAAWVTNGPLPPGARAVQRRTAVEGSSSVFVAIDGVLAGAILLEDPLRPEAVRTIAGLRRRGVRHVALVTGDRVEAAELVGRAVGVDGVLAERTPKDKVDAVADAQRDGIVVMVGDGVNDAPALAHADLGVAMGFAAAGLLAPVAGALVQEAIDVLAIVSALRALRISRPARPRPELAALADRLRSEHLRMRPRIDELRRLADELDQLPPPDALARLRAVDRFVEGALVPHELAEEAEALPLVAGTAGADDPTGALRHTHREIVRLSRLLHTAVRALDTCGPTGEDLPELRRLLYGLHAVLRLHNAQEEEAYGHLDHAADPVRA